jgi:hypothetical protein
MPMRGKQVGRHPGVSLFAAIGLLITFDARLHTAAQANQTLTISVDDPRPLARVIQTLEERLGWVITYEDPPYLYAGEIEDVTVATRRSTAPPKVRTLVPRGGPFTFWYSVPAGAAAPDEPTLLEQLLEDHRLSGHPGTFRVIRTASVAHVVPSETRNALGRFEPAVSLLDTNISIPAGERNAFRMLEAITDAVGRQSAASVSVGTVPINLLMQAHVQHGANNESGRAVLMRTLDATGRKLSWRLFCDPGSVRACALNVHIVASPTPNQ